MSFNKILHDTKYKNNWNHLRRGKNEGKEWNSLNSPFKRKRLSVQFSSVTLSCLTLCDPMDCSTPSFPVHHQLSKFTHSCPLNQGCHPTISSSVVPFSSCLQSFPPSGSFQMSQLFALGGQSIRVSASSSVLPMNIQDWFPLGWTGWSPYSPRTIVQKYQFFGTQLSL